MRKSAWLLCAALFIQLAAANAQDTGGAADPLRHEFFFINDNDAYLFKKHDAYYTNGIFLTFRSASQKAGRKRIDAFELGQMIYTPLIRKTQSAADIDRPYCGFLYGRFSRTRFSVHADALLQYAVTLGTVGGASLGEDVQNTYHELLGYSRFTGWRYQVRNAVGLDLGMLYAQTLVQDSNWIKLVPAVRASLGMNYTNISAGAYLCLGRFEKNENSALWNARIQPNSSRRSAKSYELFAYWYPEIIAQGYNATVQGGLFSKGQGAVLAEPQRLMFQHTAGICYAGSSVTVRLALTFEGREASGQKTPQQYGSVGIGFRMK